MLFYTDVTDVAEDVLAITTIAGLRALLSKEIVFAAFAQIRILVGAGTAASNARGELAFGSGLLVGLLGF